MCSTPTLDAPDAAQPAPGSCPLSLPHLYLEGSLWSWLATQGPSRSNTALVYALELIATTTTWHALTPVTMLATASLCTLWTRGDM